MLQSPLQNVATPSSGAQGGEPRPVENGPRKPASAEFQGDMQAALSSELIQLAPEDLAAISADQALASLTEQPAQNATAEDAEQWLLSMLGQREVQLQARDAQPAAPVIADALAASAAVGREQPPVSVQTLVGARSAAPGFNVRADAGLAQARFQQSEAIPSLQAVTQAAAAGDPALPQQDQPLRPADAPPSPTLQMGRAAQAQPRPVDAALAAALESVTLAAAAQPGEAAESLASSSTGNAPQAAVGVAPERALKLQGPEARWGEQMLNALRDNVEMQVQQRVQTTTIRLDPPELGSMEIFLSHELGRLSVQITASQSDVARLLQGTSERLRQDLLATNFSQVSVGISGDGQPGQQHAQQGRTRLPLEPEIGSNHVDEQLTSTRKAGVRSDVLVTV